MRHQYKILIKNFMKFYSDENSHYHALLSRVKFDDKKAVL